MNFRDLLPLVQSAKDLVVWDRFVQHFAKDKYWDSDTWNIPQGKTIIDGNGHLVIELPDESFAIIKDGSVPLSEDLVFGWQIAPDNWAVKYAKSFGLNGVVDVECFLEMIQYRVDIDFLVALLE